MYRFWSSIDEGVGCFPCPEFPAVDPQIQIAGPPASETERWSGLWVARPQLCYLSNTHLGLAAKELCRRE